MSEKKTVSISGWGRYPVITAYGRAFERPDVLAAFLRENGDVIAHALGRSYGDSALNERVVFTRRLDCILAFDPQAGVLRCESGVSLNQIIDVFLPRGWFPYVTPGSKFVTVGGAVAADVHGKNHHKEGCFSRQLLSFNLMLADGRVVRCSRDENSELFRSTCGGMGLTGVIIDVTLRLRPVKSSLIEQKIIKAKNLEQTFEAFERYSGSTYSAAWIDCLAQGSAMGRAVLTLGEHAGHGSLRPRSAKRRSVPFEFPSFVLNKYSIALFNSLYFSKARHETETHVPIDSFFYPLDAVLNWNRIYGRTGFTQYQFVLPRETSFQGLRKILDRVASGPIKPFLAVLKLLGDENDNPLSFPMDGYTLALDFRIEPQVFPLLEQLDRIVLDHGGRLYLAKDARMSPAMFRQTYQRLGTFEQVRGRAGSSEKFRSLQSRRLEI